MIMANESKKDFNAMLKDSKDMPKYVKITDEASIKKYGGDNMYFAPPMAYDEVMKKIFIKQNNIISCISIILGLPAGFYLTDWLFKTAIEESYDFGASINTETYIIAAIGTFIISYIVSKILAKKISKIDMVSSLKGNE